MILFSAQFVIDASITADSSFMPPAILFPSFKLVITPVSPIPVKPTETSKTAISGFKFFSAAISITFKTFAGVILILGNIISSSSATDLNRVEELVWRRTVLYLNI